MRPRRTGPSPSPIATTRALAILAIAVLVLAAGCSHGAGSGAGGGGQAASPGKPVSVVLWHGYTDAEQRELGKLVARFNASHPQIHVTAQFYGNSDYALQKVLTALAGGKYPDIAYLFGSNAADIARSPKVVDLTGWSQANAATWNDFWPGERAAATVGGRVVGVPALVDNLALVYNKKLFDQAHLAYPTASWTWDDFRNAAKRLTDPGKKQFGWAYVNDASEDTVWRFEALLWQAGGDILTPDASAPAFNSPAGVKALQLLHDMSVVDHSVYLDSGNQAYLGLFDSGKIGMLWTGPWDLSDIRDHKVDYGVQILPGDQSHATISGPDNWVLFDNGKARTQAAEAFMTWFTAPEQVLDWSLATGDLPTRAAATKLPGYRDYVARYPGVDVFTQNLANATKVRPTIQGYAKVSAALGQAVQSVLLGKADPSSALSRAADDVTSALGAP
jgi:multiple sugar transport system substrate-binding protein